jgi:hypothetical protein
MPKDEDNIIIRYTEEEAEADGLKLRLGPHLFCTTNLARRLAASTTDAGPRQSRDSSHSSETTCHESSPSWRR